MSATPPLPPPPSRPLARTVHRTLALVGAFALVAFVATGIALEHASALGLDRHYAPSALARWLGYRAAPPVAFAAGPHRLAQIGDLLVLDDRVLALRGARLLGAAVAAGDVAMLTSDALVVLDPNGGVVDRIALPAAAAALGTSGGRVVADSASGVYALDDALTAWQPLAAGAAVDWSRPVEIDAAGRERYQALYEARALSWATALDALHTGRIFGEHGAVVVDAAALLLLALALSGAWLARERS